MSSTIHPGTIIVASAYPDPPFELIENGIASGFDIQLIRAICTQMGLNLQRVRFLDDNFNDIFDGLEKRTCDAVISGTTITPERSSIVLFSEPYLEFNQGVSVNRRLTPNVSSIADLHGLTAGIQSGNTSDAVAKRWLAEGTIAGIRYYPYDGIATALDVSYHEIVVHSIENWNAEVASNSDFRRPNGLSPSCPTDRVGSRAFSQERP